MIVIDRNGKPVFFSKGIRKNLVKKHDVFTEKLNVRKINHGLIQSKKIKKPAAE